MKRAGGPPLAESHDVFTVNKWHLNLFFRAFYNILVAIGRTQVERSHPRVHECCLLVIHPLTFHVLMYLHWRIFN